MTDVPRDDPPGYPREFEVDVVLSDGRPAHVRPVRPEDADRFLRFHLGLSNHTRYYRFFSARPRLTPAEVEHFTVVDYGRRFALVALLDDELLAIAGYEGDRGDGRAEVAFTVDDTHQGRGISTLLLEHLAVAARARGITTFFATTLPDNRAMLTVFKRAGYAVTSRFSDGVVELEFDIALTDDVSRLIEDRERRADVASMSAILQPASIAVVGARETGGIGADIVGMLVSHHARVPVHVINRSGGTVAGIEAHRSLADLDAPADLVFAAVADVAIDDVLDECAATGARAVVVVATGIAPERQRAIVASARGRGIRVVGPASLGVLLPDPALQVHGVPIELEIRHGGVALSSQAGPFGAAVVEDGARVGLGFAAAVFVGDRSDVAGIDLLQAWEDDDRVRCVAVAVDRFGDPTKFARVVRRVSASKPVVALWAGDHAPMETVDGMFGQAGVLAVDSYEQLVDTCRVLADEPVARGGRVVVIGDALAATRTFRAALARLGETDVTVRSWGSGAAVEDTVAAAAAEADVIVAVRAPMRREDHEPVLAAVRRASAGLPVVAITMSPPGVTAGIQTFRSAHAAAAAVSAVIAYGRRRSRHVALMVPIDDIDTAALDAALSSDDDAPSGFVASWASTSTVCSALGLAVADGVIAMSADDAEAAAGAVRAPYVVKTLGIRELSPGEEGGVALDLRNAAEVGAASARMIARFGPTCLPLLVQHQVPARCQFEVTLRADDVFGPVVGIRPGRGPSRRLLPPVERLVPLLDLDADAVVADDRVAVELGDHPDDAAALRRLLLRVARLGELHPGTSLHLHPVLVGDGAAHVTWGSVSVPSGRPGPERVRGLADPPEE